MENYWIRTGGPSTSLYQQNHWTNNAEQGYHSQLLHVVGPHADDWHFHGELNNVAGEPKFSKTRTYTSRSSSFHRGCTMWPSSYIGCPILQRPLWTLSETTGSKLLQKLLCNCFSHPLSCRCRLQPIRYVVYKISIKKYRHRPVCSVTV